MRGGKRPRSGRPRGYRDQTPDEHDHKDALVVQKNDMPTDVDIGNILVKRRRGEKARDLDAR